MCLVSLYQHEKGTLCNEDSWYGLFWFPVRCTIFQNVLPIVWKEIAVFLNLSGSYWPGGFRHSTCEGVMLNIKFTYLTADVSRGFWFFRVIQNMLKTQYKCRLYLANPAIAIHSSVIVPVWLPLLVSTCSLSQCWPCQLLGRHTWVEARSSPVLSEVFLVVVWLLILYVGMSYIPCPSPCHVHAGLANLGKCFHSLNELREKHVQPLLIHWSGVAVSFLFSFLCNTCGHSQPALFCELSGHITLSHLWAFFCL